MFFPNIFTEWHIVPLLYIQIKLERACSRKTLAEGKASRRLGKYIGGFVCFCESPAIISNISSIRIRFLIGRTGRGGPCPTILSPLVILYYYLWLYSIITSILLYYCHWKCGDGKIYVGLL